MTTLLKSLVVSVACCLLASGCATAPSNAPAFSQAGVKKPDSQSSVLVLYRKLVSPVAFSVSAKLDGKLMVELPNEAFTWARLEPGEHVLTIEWPAFAMQRDQRQELTVEPGKYYFVEFRGDFYVAVGVGYSVQDLGEVSQAKALEELRRCCRYVPSRL